MNFRDRVSEMAVNLVSWGRDFVRNTDWRQTAGRDRWSLTGLLFFPVALVWLELILHLFTGTMSLHLVTWLPLTLATGMLFSLVMAIPARIPRHVVTWVLTVAVILGYLIQLVAKTTMTQFFQVFSSAGLFFDNLGGGDYNEAILSGILRSLPGFLLMLLPLVFLIVFGRRFVGQGRRQPAWYVLVLASALVFHLVGAVTMYLPWSGDLTPRELAASNENVDDQVMQLGLLKMIAVDAHFMLFNSSSIDDEDLDAVASTGEEETSRSSRKPGYSRFAYVPAGGADEPEQPPAKKVEEQAPAKPEPSATPETPEPPEPAEPAQVEAPAPDDHPVLLASLQGGVPMAQAAPAVTAATAGSFNRMNVDFDELSKKTTNKDVLWLNEYFKSVTPTAKNAYTGLFKGKNVIFFTLEGFTGYLIDPRLTPTLYKLVNEGFVFENFYTPLHYTSTSGGEMQNLTGLYPKAGNPISMKQVGAANLTMYFTLGNQFKRKGYASFGYHNNSDMYGRAKSHPRLGLDWRYGGHGLELEMNKSGRSVWPQSDKFMIEKSIDDYIGGTKPFHVYYLTISAHMPTNFTGQSMSIRNRPAVEALPYSEMTKAYLAANLEVEKAMKYLLERLQQAGKLKDTVIVMVPDHIPYFDVPVIEELAGRKFGGEKIKNLNESDVDFDLYRSSLVIWSGSMEHPVRVKKVCGQVDILPTVSNLLGLEYDSRMLAGRDILSDAEGLVVFSSRSWLTDRGLYNSFSTKFTPAPGVSMTPEQTSAYVKTTIKDVKNRRQASTLIVEEDYYRFVFGR